MRNTSTTPLLDKGQLQSVLKLLTLPPRNTYSEKLPILTSAKDIRELVQYLKRKSAGVVVAEELDRARKRLFDERKLAAYRVLGITANDDHLLTLSPLGCQFAKHLEPETQMFRHLLEGTLPYWTAVKWIHEKNLDVVTSTDLLAFWQEFYEEAIELCDHDSMKGAAISFFSLCQAAELGTVTLGKRGHITRLCVDHEELMRFLKSGSATSSGNGQEGMADSNKVIAFADLESAPANMWQRRAPLKVLILKSQNEVVDDLIRRTLEITHVESLSIERDRNSKVSLDNHLYKYANEYNALLVVLDEDSFSQDDTGRCRIKQKVLMEIGAALVLFKLRVILLGDKQFPPPEGIHLIYYQFENDTLPWEVGIDLIKTIESFKNEVRQSIG